MRHLIWLPKDCTLHHSAIEQAQQRLANANEALSRLESANTLLAVERAWSEYLIAVSAIYSKLEIGSKGFGPSEAWFGRKKKQRKDDALLRYLQQARHAIQDRDDPRAYAQPSW